MSFNFGDEPFKFPPAGGYVGFSKAPKDNYVSAQIVGNSPAPSRSSPNAPYAIIIEVSLLPIILTDTAQGQPW